MGPHKQNLLAILNGKGLRKASSRRPPYWEIILRIAEHSRVTGLLYSSLAAEDGRGPLCIPEKVIGKLKAGVRFCAMKNSILLEEFGSIAGLFADNSVPLIPLKGTYLLLTSFKGEAGTRAMTDIDILVREEDRGRASCLLESLGYTTRRYCTNKFTTMYFNEPAPGSIQTQVHLHWHISNTTEEFMAPYRDAIRVEEIWLDSKAINVGDRSILVMSPEHSLVALFEHGLRHGFARLDLVYDIHKHISYFNLSLDWKRILYAVDRWGLNAAAYFSMFLSRTYFGTTLPDEVMSSLRPHGATFAEKALQNHIIHRDYVSESLCGILYLMDAEGLWNKMRLAAELVGYKLKRTFVNNRTDYACNTMPG